MFHEIIQKVLLLFFILGFICVFAVGARLSYPKYLKVRGLAEERDRIKQRISEKGREIAEIKKKQQRFNTDREFIETLARRDRRIFPGELVFIFDD